MDFQLLNPKSASTVLLFNASLCQRLDLILAEWESLKDLWNSSGCCQDWLNNVSILVISEYTTLKIKYYKMNTFRVSKNIKEYRFITQNQINICNLDSEMNNENWVGEIL